MSLRERSAARPLPERLADAHGWLIAYYPYSSPSPEDWREWYELGATVFTHIAETDPDHHHEALAFASLSRRNAAEVGSTGTGPGIRPPARPGASHGLRETGRGGIDSTSA
jgi:hypothetical protein